MPTNPKYRPSVEKRNAPYRGISAEADDVNLFLGALHDLTELQIVSGGKDNRRGHSQQIADNFSLLYHGEGESATANAASAGTIVHQIGPVADRQDLANAFWTTERGASVTTIAGGIELACTGLLDEQGLSTVVHMEAGDIVSIRFKLTAVEAAGAVFAFGARSFNDGRDDLKRIDLNDFNDGQYIEKRLRCRGRQEVEIVLYGALEANPAASACRITDFSLQWLEEIPTGLVGTDKTIKRALAEDRERLALCRMLIHEGGRD